MVSNYISDEGNGSGKIAVIDPSGFNTAQDSSIKSSVDIGNLISDRLTEARLEDSTIEVADNKDNKTTSDTSNSDLGISFNKATYWSEVFGSYNEKGAYENQAKSETSTGGIIIGADKKIAADQRLGGFVGALKGSTEIKLTNSVISTSIDSKGLFGGAYLSKNHGKFFTDFSIIAGIIDNNSDRLVYEISGNEIAKASYKSVFITPSATIGQSLNIPEVNIPTIVSATLRYTGQWVEGYQESGTTSSNITADSRYLNTVSSRLKIESDFKGTTIAQGHFKVNARAGLEGNRVIGSRNIDITVLDQNVSVTPTARKYNIDGFVGANASYNLNDDVKIYVDIEASKGLSKSLSNNDLGLYGKIGFKIKF